MSFPVFFDTCALYGEIVNDLVLRLAEERMFVPYWSRIPCLMSCSACSPSVLASRGHDGESP